LPLVFNFFQPGIQFILLLIQPGAGLFGLTAGFSGQVALMMNLIQQIFGAQVRRVNHGARRLDDLTGQPQPLGNCQRIRAPRQANRQMIGRPQRLQVELQAGIDHPHRVVGIGLQFGVMRCHQAGDPLFHQIRQDGARQRSAFLRVGPGPQFIKDDHGLAVGALEDPYDVGDMS